MEDEIANLIGYWDWENKTANQCAAAILSLIAPILDKAEKWDRVEDTHEFKFVRHIESHLSGNQVPICTICGKTIFEIALEGEVKG